MNQKSHSFLRNYEAIFLVLLGSLALRLCVAGAYAEMLMYVSLSAVGLALALWADSSGQAWRERARLLWYPILINVVYARLGSTMRLIGYDSYDTCLLAWDEKCFGRTPAWSLIPFLQPWLTEIVSICYLLFFPAVLSLFVVAVWKGPRGGAALFRGLISLYAIGFMGYTLVPAAGPHLAWSELFPAWQDVGFFTRLNAHLVEQGSNRVDVFPSLHSAITWFFLGYWWRMKRQVFWLCLLPACGLFLATLYLRYHYGVDVIAGIFFGSFCLRLTFPPNPP
ncbi:MAG: phosphatase PAP2 family protein [Akkermansiaceae bacterium]|jgi:membrane-associated phospholipid phosphatase